jgi:AraC-like DNA-binding protein
MFFKTLVGDPRGDEWKMSYHTISAAASNFKLKQGHLIKRPKGLQEFIFSHNITAISYEIDASSGIVHPGGCHIITPGIPHLFYADQFELKANWFHFSGIAVSELLESLEIPINTVFYPTYTDFIPLSIQEIQSVYQNRYKFWERNLNNLIENFFIHLSRNVNESYENHRNSYKNQLWLQFRTVREEILHYPERDWNISRLADDIHLSSSRFYYLYKEFFSTTPKDDIIRGRIEKAKYMLLNTTAKIQEVSSSLGYDNMYHFIRQFKKYVGSTPGKYYSIVSSVDSPDSQASAQIEGRPLPLPLIT